MTIDTPKGRAGLAGATDTWTGQAVCALALGMGLVVVALVFVRTSARTLDAYSLPKEIALHLAATTAAVAAVRGSRFTIGRVELLLGLGFLLSVASATIAAQNPWWALRGLALSSSALLIFWSARQIVSSRARELVFSCAVLGLVGLALVVLLEAHGVIPSLSMPGRAPGGPEGNRNFTAHLLVLGLPLLTYRALIATHRSLRIVAVLGLALALATILISRSRGAWLGGMAMAGLMAAMAAAFKARPSMKGTGVLAGAVLMGALLAQLPTRVGPVGVRGARDLSYGNTFARIGEYREGTGRGRLIQYRTTLAMIAEQPWLGVGPGNWSVAYPRHSTPPDPSYVPDAPQPVNRLPNSDVLGLVAERGLPCALMLVAALVLLLAGAVRQLRRSRGRGGDGARAWLALATTAALLVMGSVDAVALRVGPAFFVAAILGLCLPGGGPADGTTARVRTAISVVIVVLGAVFACQALAAVKSLLLARSNSASILERAWRLDPGNFSLAGRAALKYAADGDCQRARHLAQAALRYYPGAPQAGEAIAECERRREWVAPP
jgi:putative inorganic carbon (hco3(-)) transporter